MKKHYIIIAALVFLCFNIAAQTAVAPSGSGTVGSPYQITNWQNLYWISQNSAQWSKYYIQTADIDFAEASPAINTWASGAGWTPIGNGSTFFTGNYNGQGYMIKGLYANRASTTGVGLFGYVRNGSISNILFLKADITGSSSVGIAVGYAYGNISSREASNISNIYVQGNVTASLGQAGGLVGYIFDSNATVTNCHSNVSVTSQTTDINETADIGGLIGIIYQYTGPTVSNSSSSGTVTGQGLRNAGGFIGYVGGGIVSKCFSTANVINTGQNQGNVGGFIGGLNSRYNNTLIENCYSLGNVSGGANNSSTEWHNGIGSFIGTCRREYSGYSKTITNCYAVGAVSQTGSSADIGGFIGRLSTTTITANPTVTNSYWDIQRSTQSTTAGNKGTGLTTAQMKVQSNFTSWDFANTWKMSSTITYDGYPTLEWAKGYATAPTSNQITALNNLVYVAENSSRWATAYTQTANVNAWWTCGWDYQKGWTPIGNNTTEYTGTTYDGDNFEVNHLFINRSSSDFQGFFGYINGTEVKDLTIKNANISARSSLAALSGSGDNVTIRNCHVTGSISGIGASADFTGGVIGDSRGNSLIEYSSANVSISGLHDVGALVGRVLNDGSTSTVRYCYSKGTVTGTGGYIGGLAGQNNGTISNCFSEATVKGSGYKVGGLVGFQWYGSIDKCYSKGSVTGSSELGGLVGGRTGSTTTNSYWDTQTSGRATSVEGTGKTTAYMKLASTYIAGGWDFVKVNNVWAMNYNENSGYPFIRTQEFSPTALWLGTNTTAWESAVNWSEAEVAGSTTNLIIPNVTNDPIVADGITATANNITIEAGAELTANANGRLTISGDVVNNGTFTLKSDDVASSTLKITGAFSGTGTYNMQAFLTAGRNWYVSSPVLGAKSSVFNAASNPVYWYDEAHGSSVPWAVINDNITDIVPFRGYIATVPSNGNVTFTGGAFNNSDEILTLYRTAGQTKEGFNLVGNPYPAFYDFGSSTKTNIQPSYWYRAKNTGNTAYVFDTYSVTNGLGTSLSGKSVTGNIPPMQAFWVRVDDGQSSGTISFNKQYINHRDESANRRRTPAATTAKYIRLQVSNGVNYDEAILLFNPLASDNFDAYDSPKMSNGSAAIPELYSKAGNETVAINGMKAFETEKNVALGFNTAQNTNFTIKASEITGFDAGYRIVLYDAILKTEHDLTSLSNYEFSSSAVNTLSRFEVRFKAPGIATGFDNSANATARFIRTDNTHIALHYSGQLSNNDRVTIYNTAGMALANSLIRSNTTEIHLPYPAGVYMVQARLANQTIMQKIIIQ